MSDQIKHTDIYEPSLMDGFVKEILAGINVLDNLEKKTLEVSGVIKKNLSNTDIGSFDGIKKVTEAQKQANEVYKESERLSKLKTQAERELSNALTEQAKEIASLKVQLQEVNRLNKENARATNEQLGAYTNASARLSQMRKQWKDLAIAQKENTKEAIALKNEVIALDNALKKVDADVGQFTRNVGNYGGAINPLSNSLTQITRELPAFTNSLQTGFMGISNNIPTLVDDINKLKKANESIVAEGGKAKSIFGTLTSALFSWQTALSVGITMLTMYGQKIVEFITGSENAKEATKRQKEEQEKLNDEYSDTIRNIDRLKESVKADIDFQTRARVANARRSGSSEQEIAKIEKEGRDKRLKALQDDMDRRNSLEIYYLRELNKTIDKGDAEAIKSAEKRYSDAVQYAKEGIIAYDRAEQQNVNTNQEANNKILDLDKQAQDKAKQQRLKDLALQHKINTAKINSNEDEMDRKILLIQENLRYQVSVNKEEIDNVKKRNELNANLALEAERELMDILIDATQKGIDLKAEEYDLRIKNEQEFRDLMNKLIADMEEEQAKEDAKKEKDRIKEEQKRFKDSINALQQFSNDRNAIKMREVERDIELSKRRETELQAIALQGSEDARNNIAFERRRQAELERERRRQIEAQKRTELGLSVLKAYQSNVERDPNGALKRTLTDISVLSGAIRSLPSFEKGTENTGKQGNGIDGRGGFLSVLHPEERVMTKGQNKKVGGLSNEELSDIAWMYNIGMLKNATEVKTDINLNELNTNVKELISVVKSRPTQNIDIDVVKKLWTITEKSNKGVTKKTGLFK